MKVKGNSSLATTSHDFQRPLTAVLALEHQVYTRLKKKGTIVPSLYSKAGETAAALLNNNPSHIRRSSNTHDSPGPTSYSPIKHTERHDFSAGKWGVIKGNNTTAVSRSSRTIPMSHHQIRNKAPPKTREKKKQPTTTKATIINKKPTDRGPDLISTDKCNVRLKTAPSIKFSNSRRRGIISDNDTAPHLGPGRYANMKAPWEVLYAEPSHATDICFGGRNSNNATKVGQKSIASLERHHRLHHERVVKAKFSQMRKEQAKQLARVLPKKKSHRKQEERKDDDDNDNDSDINNIIDNHVVTTTTHHHHHYDAFKWLRHQEHGESRVSEISTQLRKIHPSLAPYGYNPTTYDDESGEEENLLIHKDT